MPTPGTLSVALPGRLDLFELDVGTMRPTATPGDLKTTG